MGNARSKKIEGGQDGKRGHSNMTHWEHTGEIKAAARIQRRRLGRAEVDDQLKELRNTPDVTAAKRQQRVR